MIFPLSCVFCIAGISIAIWLSITSGLNIFWAISLGILTFIIIIAIFVIIILILLPILGKHFSKTYNPRDKKRWFFMNDVARFSCFWLGVIIHKHGFDKIPTDKPIVIYANHQSYLDMFIFYMAFKKFPHATMYKKELKNVSVASGMAQALGGISINRDNDREAAEAIVKIIKEIRKGTNFLIFPEGTRSKGIELHEYKAGSFKIIQKCDAYMVTLVLDGAYRKKMSIPFLPTHVYLNVLEVVPSDELINLSTHEIASAAQKKVNDDLNRARNKYKYLRIKKNYIKKSH